MFVPAVLFFASLLLLFVSLIFPGWGNLILLAVPSTIASFVLLVSAAWHRPQGMRGSIARAKTLKTPNWIVVDGSNVMYWKDETPRIETVREVVNHLTKLGFTPGVVFDANAGYKVSGRYRHNREMGTLLGLPTERVMVVAKGTPADPILLAAARDLGARVVTNDRFRDWEDPYPEVGRPNYLIRGGYKGDNLWLEVD